MDRRGFLGGVGLTVLTGCGVGIGTKVHQAFTHAHEKRTEEIKVAAPEVSRLSAENLARKDMNEKVIYSGVMAATGAALVLAYK